MSVRMRASGTQYAAGVPWESAIAKAKGAVPLEARIPASDGELPEYLGYTVGRWAVAGGREHP